MMRGEAAADAGATLGRRAHQREQLRREARRRRCPAARRRPEPSAIACTAARAAPSGFFSPMRRATSAVAADAKPDGERVDDREHRLGEADRGDRLGSQLGTKKTSTMAKVDSMAISRTIGIASSHDGAPERLLGVSRYKRAGDGLAQRRQELRHRRRRIYGFVVAVERGSAGPRRCAP